MASDSVYRKSFIDSSIKIARLFDFEGLDLWWVNSYSSFDMPNLDILLEKWQDAITLEARNSTRSKLILTAEVNYSPSKHPSNFPVESIQQHLDWVHVRRCDDLLPDFGWTNFTVAPMALYNPSSTVCSTDLGIKAWIKAGLPAKKIVMFLPYFGAAWTLVNPKVNGIGAPATSVADVKTKYKDIKNNFNLNRAKVTFDKNYVVNYFTMGTSWIAFDDVESIQKKVSYAKEKGLLGYFVWQVAYDDNWVLSQAAADDLEANTERIVGTHGYVPPEYARRGIYLTKSDVYSFGVLLLQIISGKKVSILYGENDDISLLDYAYKLWKDDKGMDFMDPSLDDTFSSCKLMTCLKIALLCVQETPNDRPTMIEVFSMLKNEATCITIPKKPAFSRLSDENEQNKSEMHLEVCSVNDATISEVVAR
ncbi:hypothetical protein LWI29_026304 [Acer saccharum]|uniref:GH18 domain-containing protein n=1 Tax=Acer saccharum TaxID=4024 RepID=A0AA39SLT7_ACESA|nr:hypothetical protein LWI29_026304 [Acer saccharum]